MRWRGTWEPAPAARWEDAFLAGNGRHGVMVHGDPADERLIVNHHLLVRPNGSETARAPFVAPGLERLRDDVLAGRAAEAVARTTAGVELKWVRPFHPAFAVRVRMRMPAAGELRGYRREVDFRTGVVRAEWDGGEAETFVSRADDVIVHRLVGAGAVTVAHDARLEDAPADLTVTHSATADAVLRTDVEYPDAPGYGYTGWTRVVAEGGAVRVTERAVTVEGATEVLLLTHVVPWPAPAADPVGGAVSPPPSAGRFVPTLPQTPSGGTPIAPRNDCPQTGGPAAPGTEPQPGPGGAAPGAVSTAGVQRVGGLGAPPRPPGPGGEPPWGSGGGAPRGPEPGRSAPGFGELLARHAQAHGAAYDRVTLDLDAPERDRAQPGTVLLAEPQTHRAALLERLFDAGRYHLLSSSGMLPPRLTGIWTGSWDTAWAGAFTCDANLNLQIASAAVAELPEVSLAHAEFVKANLDDWRDNAARLFGAPGIVAPAHSDGLSGRSFHFSDAYPLHLWTAGADWLLHPLLDHVAVTGDEDFLRETLAPLLAETAAFYESFLTRADADGNLLVVPSYSPENTPDGAASPISVNATMDVAAARHALRAAGNDALADRLPPYRVNEDGALAEWAWPSAPDNYDHRHISHLYPVWPLDDINPIDTPELARAAHRALELRGAENDSAHGYLHTALVAARLGDAGRVSRALREVVIDGDFFHPSLMSAHYPRRDVWNADAAHTLPAVLIESLIHSTPDRLLLLPAVPADLPSGTLRGIRTRCRVTVAELTWSPEHVHAVLRPDSDVTLNVHVGTDSDDDGVVRAPVTLKLPAGRDTVLDSPLGGATPHNT